MRTKLTFLYVFVFLVTAHTQTWTNFTQFNSGLASNNVTSIAIDSIGNLWFGTWGNGVSKFDGTNWTTYNKSNGLANDSVQAITVDAHNNVWIGTGARGPNWVGKGSGASKFDGTKWTTFNTNNSGLVDNNINAIAIDGMGNLWFGTNYGVSKYNGNNWTSYLPPNIYRRICILSIAEDAQGIKWFGADGSDGVSKFDGVFWTNYNTANSGLVYNKVTSIAIDEKGNKWFGTGWGGVSKFDGFNWTSYTTVNSGLSNDYVSSVTIDKLGKMWFGTNGGVLKFDGTNWTNYTTSNSGLTNNGVTSIVIDKKGNKWIGTVFGGISKFDEETVGIHDPKTEINIHISTFPNPSSNETTLRFPYPGKYSLLITDLTGRSVKLFPELMGDMITIKTSDMKSGLYLFSLRSFAKGISYRGYFEVRK